MKWVALAAIGIPVVGVIWMSALVASETFAACRTRDDAIRFLRDPDTTPIAPLGWVIRLWLRFV